MPLKTVIIGTPVDMQLVAEQQQQTTTTDGSVKEDKFVFHNCVSCTDFARTLVQHMLVLDGLPCAIGGRLGANTVVEWQELRIRHEWDLPIPYTAWKTAELYGIPWTNASFSSLTTAAKAERQRRLDVVHSRRKRSRSKVALKGLRERCNTLTRERQQLMEEGRKLEELIQQAKGTVKKHKVGG